MRGKRAAPTTLACNGNVAFRELPNAQANNPGTARSERRPTDGRAARHRRARDDPWVRSASRRRRDRRRLAQIRARGMTVHAADVKLDVGQNRLWIDGPGVAEMVLKRGFAGRETPTPTPLELQWQGGLVFDGRTIVVERGVASRRSGRSAALRRALRAAHRRW